MNVNAGSTPVQAELVAHVVLDLEAEVAAADHRDRVAAAVAEQDAGGDTGGVGDAGAVVLALQVELALGEAGAAVAVPEDVGVLLGEVGHRLGDLAGADDQDVDGLLGEVLEFGGGVGGLDVVDDDHLAEAVLGSENDSAASTTAW